MGDYSESLVLEVFSSPFVEENLFLERLGGSKTDPETVRRYLALPLAARPEVSFFFDREYYWRRYQDILTAGIDPLVHFMKWGVGEMRTPHPIIDIKHMLTIDPDLLGDPPTIDALHDVLCHDRVDPSPLFSLEFYRSQLDGSDAPTRGLLCHFLESGLLRGFRPNPSFDPIAYYHWNHDRTFDLRSALRNFVLSGKALPDSPQQPPTEGEAKTLFRARAEAMQLLRRQEPLRFAFAGVPDLSAIVVTHDNFALTLQTLASLRMNYPGPIELILVDSGSTDETRHLAQYVSGANLLRLDHNVGFVCGCNAGLELATAEAVLFLNNDVELREGAVATALRRLRSDDAIGAVGAKVVRTHGLLQEAGSIIWRDGWTVGYQRDRSPLAPEANFVRDVDFCSGVFLLVRASLLHDFGGFDEIFAPSYFEDTDLCVRIREAGYRVVYDPAVVVEHLEYGSSRRAADVHERIRMAHDVFFQKHRSWLRLRHASDTRAQLFARSVNSVRGRVLLIEDQLPLRRLGSGFVRSNDLIGVMAAMGYHVTVYPIQRSRNNLAAVYADFPDTVEVMHDRSLADLEQFLKSRRGYYTTIWIARTHNLDLVKPVLEEGGVDVLGGVRVVLDTEAITAKREARRQSLLGSGEPPDVAQAVRHELRNAYFCQSIVAVSAEEAALLQGLGFSDVKVLGHFRPLALTERSWPERHGLLFVGALPGMDSPNYDSLCWFVEAVLPLIEKQLGYETRLTIAGFVGNDVDLGRFRAHPRITLCGPLADMTALYDTHRVFVAPTRYAGGLPYKVQEAASCGVPVVATELLRAQLGWQDGRDLLAADAADPSSFARQVLRIYQSEALWKQIRDGAAERIRADCGRESWERMVADILDDPRTQPP